MREPRTREKTEKRETAVTDRGRPYVSSVVALLRQQHKEIGKHACDSGKEFERRSINHCSHVRVYSFVLHQ
jgi:hypothetical protein